MNVLVFGGSRNIGYRTALRLLSEGATVTFQLRSLRTFDDNKDIRHFVALGKARLVEGDALNPDDVKSAWEKANQGNGIDFVLFTIGGTPTFKLTEGFIIDPPNLCTQSLLNVICTMPKLGTPAKFIVITSTGLTKESHTNLPTLLRPMYSYLLAGPHTDKLGAERILAHCCGREWVDEEPKPEIMTGKHGNWSERGRLPTKGGLTDIVIIRPALLTDGECRADKSPDSYRVSERDLSSGWTISRKDVSHFVVEGAMKKWSEYEGKTIHIAY